MLVTADITGAYLNILHEDGDNCLFKALKERNDKTIPSSLLVKLLDLIQKYNIFEFHDGQVWKKHMGVTMGIHPAPFLANIYIAKGLYEAIKRSGYKHGEESNSLFQI